MIDSQNTKTKWLIKYTIVFTFACFIVYSLQIYYHKSFIYTQNMIGDGLLQHFSFLSYYGHWLRQILKNLFVDHVWSIPNFDLSLGFGEDIITTLSYYVLGEPWNLLAVFFHSQNTEILYNILVIIRLYIAGIAFFKYCLYRGYDVTRILPGSIIYVFSAYTIIVSVLHPFFLNPLIYFPMILLGIDKVYKERRPTLFIFSCALAAIDNFYFFYMLSILMFFYGIIGYFEYKKNQMKISTIIKKIFEFIIYYLIAVLLAAPIFLPSIISILSSSGRIGMKREIPILYESIYYLKFPLAFINASADYYVHLGFGLVGCLAVLLLFLTTYYKTKLDLKIAFLGCCLLCLFPLFGHLLNGFGYVVNRWIWAFCFVVSIIVVEMMPHIEKFSFIAELGLICGTIIFIIPVIFYRLNKTLINRKAIFILAIVICTSCVITVMSVQICRHMRCKKYIDYILIILLNSFLSMYSFYSPYAGNDIAAHGDQGKAWENISNGALALCRKIGSPDINKVRIDTSGLTLNDIMPNSSLAHNINSVSFYYSTINATTKDFLREFELPTSFEYRLADLDSRALLLSAMGVKYDIVQSGKERYLPYGFDKLVKDEKNYSLYESNYSLPLAYWYDSILEESDFTSLSVLEKQQALLQTAVLERNSAENTNKIAAMKIEDLDFTDTNSKYEIVETYGLVEADGSFHVSKAGAYLILHAPSIKNAERYFSFKGLSYEGSKSATIMITDGIREKSLEVLNKTAEAYSGISDFLCNVGYAQEHKKEYKIIFEVPGTYTWESLEILNQPLDSLDQWVYFRKEPEIVYTFKEDAIFLELNPQMPGVLYLPIPYSTGWQAYLDGQKTIVTKTNHFGMGICLEPGVHKIELVYHTPYMKLGIIMLLIGIVGYLLLYIQIGLTTYET